MERSKGWSTNKDELELPSVSLSKSPQKAADSLLKITVQKWDTGQFLGLEKSVPLICQYLR